jgi:hypothetical protein
MPPSYDKAGCAGVESKKGSFNLSPGEVPGNNITPPQGTRCTLAVAGTNYLSFDPSSLKLLSSVA